MNNNPIIVEQTYLAPIMAVWKIITDKNQMQQWFFESITEFEAKIGFETEFNIPCEEKDFLHILKVTKVNPQKNICYQWRYGGYSGDSSVTWDLSQCHEGAKLKLTHSGHETLQRDLIFSRDSGIVGRSYFLQESLKIFLEKQ